MADPRLERRLRRINGDILPARGWLVPFFLASAAIALASPTAPLTVLATTLLAALAGLAWLRGYRRARPGACEIVHDLAIGAFIGGSIAAVVIEPAAPLREWLRAPARGGAPAIGLVFAVAMIEDLVRTLIRSRQRT